MEKRKDLFNNVDKAIKIIAKVIFYICIVVGALLFLCGLIDKIFHIYFSGSWRFLGYLFDSGNILTGLGICLSSLSVLPLYGFVELISIGKDIRNKLNSKEDKE